MQNRESSSCFRSSSTIMPPFKPIDNLSKKRPSTTKLDIEKMYGESLELTEKHKLLTKENKQLKDQYSKVESVKLNRQNLISTVEKIVAEKSKQTKYKNKQKFSWLVHNLGNKIDDLRGKIEQKEKAIADVLASKESQIIQQKQQEIQRLDTIIQEAKDSGNYIQGLIKDPAQLSQIKEIVWMEQELTEKKTEIAEAQQVYQKEEQEVKAWMEELAVKKAELKSIKEMEAEYNRTQELYKEEKRKKEQRIAGNKTFLEDLQNQKTDEVIRLEQLKSKFSLIETQQKKTIQDLKKQLADLRTQFHERAMVKKETCIKLSEKKLPQSNKKEVIRVTFEQVRHIAENLNFLLALKEVSHEQIGSYFSQPEKQEYSIKEMSHILQSYPFELQDPRDAVLMARYTVEDEGDGYFFEDLDTSQSACIIRSIMAKLVGQVKIFNREQSEELRQRIGPVLFKFGKLVQQSLDVKEHLGIKQGGKLTKVPKEVMVDALQNTLSSIQSETFFHQEIDFTILYLFSWSHDLQRLQVGRIFSMQKDGVNWPASPQQQTISDKNKED